MARTRTIVIDAEDGDEEKLVIRLRKVSIRRSVEMLEEIFELFEEIQGDVQSADQGEDSQKVEPAAVVSAVMKAGDTAINRAAALIAKTVDEPKMTADDLLDLDADVFLEVLATFAEMNVTDRLVKNFDRLKGIWNRRVVGVVSGTNHRDLAASVS